ncbi:hypothetical protein GE21DRAFT_134 [Neurospora crassa]|uniref:Ergot alkaloid biosynthetic protein A n=1 Tax=Neurospora crassa (strain ATCC 24698 / 74-OR23-1A / CBS 708.71 / DSM 1257 / FGSC 987) TaxID=367110 RepID=Q7SCP1_NEUCR|nr:ergot alkaloid biosynthetic protein A [Neurospora crassa OR74A]EAA34517.1 ergot alkaloid biosynthetic protein A [Neurospora crassa OR74A]KHE79710.1 hypothetical protein GE21DRAFT_134 [Neurospora crassa]|eukprot:XP_963753.1 ergot alkaloid biosynthetic protein A [Neurospora crassa OR74A]
MTRSRKTPILLLDGTGVVPSRIARRLAASSADKHPLLVASILGEDPNGVKFNLYDSNTWENPFARAQELFGSDNEMESDGMIHSIYLTAPNSPPSSTHVHSHASRTSTLAASDEQQERAPSPSPSQQASLLMQFVDYARLKHGTRRFVLQSASAMEPGGFSLGRVHAYLRELGQRGEAEWAVLRPTWCQQDFEQPCHVKSIKEENRLYSATSRGKIPWVSADDIAAVAVEALTNKDAPNTEYLVLGPELLGYDDIASILSSVLGRKIVHVDLSSHDLERRQQSFGCSEEHSRLMSSLDTAIKYGTENRTNDVVLSMTGNKPKSFREYAESAKHLWV